MRKSCRFAPPSANWRALPIEPERAIAGHADTKELTPSFSRSP
jgi:hypothetical protein